MEGKACSIKFILILLKICYNNIINKKVNIFF
nr:MAG TPA: hypothetical protein [Caudoviricetes sp.]